MSQKHKRHKPTDAELKAPIKAKPLPRPGRWIAATIILLLAIGFVVDAAGREAYRWDIYFQYLLDTRIATAALHTIALTVLAMIIGVVGGAILAVLRMSPNPVMSSVAWVYLWIFRGTPIYVQLVIWGLLGNIYSMIGIGSFQISVEQMLSNMFLLAVLGLGFNEAGYMAEIVRAGIQAVPEGQTEASKALGMNWWQTTRRTILPQAMRIIIPPTGNEFISLLKTTSLVIAVPYTLELYGRGTDIGQELFLPVPLLLVAATWYLAITSVLMVVQYYVEQYYSRGASRQLTGRQLAALADAEGHPPANTTVVERNEKRFSQEDPR
ncbi:amino acid ABC transporter permease [Corynebacterium sp. TAE3-ERU12]|uniref:amino acid ABC transporter permease n=1 Tax=Corynebacterium sp. TAE3-ERU12 TaxID=2849491 RepID=UPI001C441421|nr:amino acid ABC transporter permease [Corynebacterium sp. TAE3-ERU12]